MDLPAKVTWTVELVGDNDNVGSGKTLVNFGRDR